MLSNRTLNLGADHARTRSMLRIMRGMLLLLRRILRFLLGARHLQEELGYFAMVLSAGDQREGRGLDLF